MSSSRIEQIIEEIEDYVENCRYQPLSTTKIVVNKEELEELLRELRLKTPDEIKRYQKIIGNRDAILADAQEKADQIVREAQSKASELISQTEIMKQAYGQANETINDANKQAQDIVDAADKDAENIRMSAISYTDELLTNLSTIMGNTLSEATDTFNSFSGVLKNYYDVVNENKRQLAPMESHSAGTVPDTPEEAEKIDTDASDEEIAPAEVVEESDEDYLDDDEEV
ncbi:MAG: ATPase [Bilifractor sp.]|jgi:ABC-type transporter Mla subunit MlaD